MKVGYTLDMIGVWPTKSKKGKFFFCSCSVLCVCFVLLCFIYFFFYWSSSPSFHLSQDFLNLLGFRLNAFLYCSKVIPNSIILLQNCLFYCWLQFFFFERVPFFWHSYLFLNARNWFSALNACADALDILRLKRLPTCAFLLIFRFLDDNLKWKTSQLEIKILKWS